MTMLAENRTRHLTLLKNAAAGLGRGGVTTLIALVQPLVLVRSLPAEQYAIWVLVLQMSAYVGYLDFGTQTTVGRLVADAEARGDAEGRDRIISTALVLLTGLAGLALGLVALLAWLMPVLIPSLPPAFSGEGRFILFLVGGSLALALPGGVVSGLFAGRQRYTTPSVIVAASRIAGALSVIAAAHFGAGLKVMAAATALANAAGTLALLWAARRAFPYIRMAAGLVTRTAARALAGIAAGLYIWQIGMLLVSGLDLTLVGAFEFRAVPPYSVAATGVTLITCLVNMVFGILVPETAAMNARGESQALGALLLRTTRYAVLALLALGLPLIAAARPLFALWVGPACAATAAPLFQVLMAASVIRLSAVPYSVVVVGIGQQRITVITAMLEGGANLAISLAAARTWGAMGIAVGTLAASSLAVVANILYNIPRTTGIHVCRSQYATSGLGRPLLCFVPGVLIAALFLARNGSLVISLCLWAAISATILWKAGLTEAERSALRSLWSVRRPVKGPTTSFGETS